MWQIPADCFYFFTCHWVKELVGLQVSEGREAAWATEGGTVCRVSLICLNAPSHVIQLILHHVHKYPKQKSKNKQTTTFSFHVEKMNTIISKLNFTHTC